MSSDLQNKMHQWEVKPPAEAWNKITASLDTDDEYMIAQKLSSYESAPPRHVWDHIEAELEVHQPARVVSFYQKHKRALQYSGAAAALIFAVVLINFSISKPSASNELTHQSGLQQLPQLPNNANSSPDTDHVSAGMNEHTDSQTHADQNRIAAANEEETNIPQHSSKASYKPLKSSSYHAVIDEWKQAKDSLVNRYFVHTNNKGEAIRFSSKLYDLFECSDEWTERECAQQIKLWQQKAATSAIYASADFTGVLEILKGMQRESGSNDE